MRRPSWKVARGRIELLGRRVLPDVAGHGRQLRYFCAVARMGGFTRASEQGRTVARKGLSQDLSARAVAYKGQRVEDLCYFCQPLHGHQLFANVKRSA